MGTMKPRGVPVNFDGQERMFLFTLNTIDEIQEETGKTMQEIMEELTEDRGKRETLKYVVMTLLNEEAERAKRKGLEEIPTSVTLQDVGDMVGMDNLIDVTAAILVAYGYSFPETEEDDPNQESGQQT